MQDDFFADALVWVRSYSFLHSGVGTTQASCYFSDIVSGAVLPCQ